MTIHFILLGLLTLIVYAWSKEWLGARWALIPAFLTLFSPHFISESPLISLGILVGLFSFFHFLFHPSRLNLFTAGVALGVAQLTDATAVILYPYIFFLLILFYCFGVLRDWNVTAAAARLTRVIIRARRYFSALVMIFGISIAIFFLANLPITRTVGQSVAVLAQHYDFRILPASDFSIGLILQQPLPLLILFAIALLTFVIRFIASVKNFNFISYINTNFTEFAIVLFTIFYWNFGLTITPIILLLGILLVEPIRAIITTQGEKEVVIVLAHEVFSFSAKWLVLLVLLAWYAIGTVYMYLG